MVNNYNYGLNKMEFPPFFKLDIQNGEEIIIANNLPLNLEGNQQNQLIKFRFIIYFHFIKDIP